MQGAGFTVQGTRRRVRSSREYTARGVGTTHTDPAEGWDSRVRTQSYKVLWLRT